MKPIQDNWNIYKETVLKEASQEEVIKANLSFYSGANFVIELLGSIPEKDPKTRTETIEAIMEEVKAFRETVLNFETE